MKDDKYIKLDLPMERDFYYVGNFKQDCIKELIKNIVDVNEDDDRLETEYEIYGFEYVREPIKIYIDSYGGYIYQCFGLVGVMESSKTEIHTIVTGIAASAGFITAISGHKRYAYKYSTFMYHQGSCATHHQTFKDTELDIEENKRQQKIIEQIVLSKTKITKNKLKEVYDKKIDWHVGPKEALKLGIIDEII